MPARAAYPRYHNCRGGALGRFGYDLGAKGK